MPVVEHILPTRLLSANHSTAFSNHTVNIWSKARHETTSMQWGEVKNETRDYVTVLACGPCNIPTGSTVLKVKLGWTFSSSIGFSGHRLNIGVLDKDGSWNSTGESSGGTPGSRIWGQTSANWSHHYDLYDETAVRFENHTGTLTGYVTHHHDSFGGPGMFSTSQRLPASARSIDKKLARMDIQVSKTGSGGGSPARSCWMELRAARSSDIGVKSDAVFGTHSAWFEQPDTTLIATSDAIAYASFSSGAVISFTFPTEPVLDAGTNYFAVLNHTDYGPTTSQPYIGWRYGAAASNHYFGSWAVPADIDDRGGFHAALYPFGIRYPYVTVQDNFVFGSQIQLYGAGGQNADGTFISSGTGIPPNGHIVLPATVAGQTFTCGEGYTVTLATTGFVDRIQTWIDDARYTLDEDIAFILDPYNVANQSVYQIYGPGSGLALPTLTVEVDEPQGPTGQLNADIDMKPALEGLVRTVPALEGLVQVLDSAPPALDGAVGARPRLEALIDVKPALEGVPLVRTAAPHAELEARVGAAPMIDGLVAVYPALEGRLLTPGRDSPQGNEIDGDVLVRAPLDADVRALPQLDCEFSAFYDELDGEHPH